MKLTQQIHTILNRAWSKGNGRRVTTAIVLWAGLTVAVMAVVNVRYFRVVNGIPHLPVVKSYLDVTSPKPGAIVFDSLMGSPYLYTGKHWISMCTQDMPHYAADSVKYFQVVNGIPCLPIQAKVTGASTPGAIYFPTDSTGVQMNNGTTWGNMKTFMDNTNVKNGSTYARMGGVTGINGAFVIPIRSTPPAVTADDAGTIYIDSITADLKSYNGTAWQSLDCSGCPPNVSGITVGGDFAKMLNNNISMLAPNDFQTVGYAYYDKDGSLENTAPTIYRWFLSANADGTGSTTDLYQGTDKMYKFSYVDSLDGKYLNVGVTAFALTGISTSPETVGHWLLKNCPPQVTGVTVNGDFAKMSSNDFKPGYGYYDKEGNPEKASSAEYRWWLSDTPGGAENGAPTVVNDVYTYIDEDDGKYINVGVKTKANTGFAQSAETVGSAYLKNCPPQVTGVTANGDFTFLSGNTQTFNGGYGYYDKEGNAEKASSATYKWYLSASAGGASTADKGASAALSYTYTDADDGKYLNLEVTTKAATGFAQSDKTTGSWLLKNCPPQVVGATVNGDFAYMKTSNDFKAGYGYYDKEGNPENSAGVVYRWWLSSTANGGAIGSPTISGDTYTYKDADDGLYINVGVTVKATNGYSISGEMVASALVKNCPPQAGNVRVAGTLTSGQVVRAEYSYYDKEGNAEGTPTYQWYRASTASGTGAIPISGATFANYTLQSTDKTYYIGVQVTPKAAKGYSLGTAKTGWSTAVVN
jgi:hypothetical protein